MANRPEQLEGETTLLLATLPFLAPAAVIAAAVVAFRGPGQRPAETLRFAETATLAAFAVAVASGRVSNVVEI
jgi:NAD(P)H-quinone oxidoreductase subunit 5